MINDDGDDNIDDCDDVHYNNGDDNIANHDDDDYYETIAYRCLQKTLDMGL